MDVPKKIWIFWEQGFDKAPQVCKICLNSWILKNKSWEINVLDKNKLKDFIDVEEINKDFYEIQPIQTRSDLIRTLLLKKYGGVWVDATLYCFKSLDDWLSEVMNNQKFFTFTYPNKHIASWFISSVKDNPFFEKLAMNYFEFFRNNLKAKHYFQYHEVFNKLNEKEEKNTKTLDARKARILKYSSNAISNKNFRTSFLENLKCPVFKLSHKVNFNGLNKMMKTFKKKTSKLFL
jgi:mannosyltransferase OCH1-like enzyme